MVRWWWVRHGPTHRRDMNGWTDVPVDLSDRDKLDRLANFLPSEATVISSDLRRAVDTADALQRGRPRLPHESALREIHFGAWEARTYDEIQQEDPKLARLYWERPGDVRPPGGETWHDLSRRVGQAVGWLTGEAGDIVAVAHFGTILTQIQRARDCSPRDVMEQKVDHFSVTCLCWDGRRWSEELVNHHP